MKQDQHTLDKLSPKMHQYIDSEIQNIGPQIIIILAYRLPYLITF